MSDVEKDDSSYIEGVKQRTEALDKILSEFGDRLRRMRERNRRTQREVESFQTDLDELHEWLVDRL